MYIIFDSISNVMVGVFSTLEEATNFINNTDEYYSTAYEIFAHISLVK